MSVWDNHCRKPTSRDRVGLGHVLVLPAFGSAHSDQWRRSPSALEARAERPSRLLLLLTGRVAGIDESKPARSATSVAGPVGVAVAMVGYSLSLSRIPASAR